MKALMIKALIWALGGKRYPKQVITSEMNEAAAKQFLEHDSEKAFEYIKTLCQEAIDKHNSALSERRNVYMAIFITSGTFLTVALPFLSLSTSAIAKSVCFQTIVLMLLVSFLLGMCTSIAEWTMEIERSDEMLRNAESSNLFLLQQKYKESADKLILCIDDFRKGDKFWRYLIVLRLRTTATVLFFLGIIGFVFLMLFIG